MSTLKTGDPKGILRQGWTAEVGDYAIAGGWACGGKVLVVCDAAGGVTGLDGASGTPLWSTPDAHAGGCLALSVHPTGDRVATAGQDGQVQVRDAQTGSVKQILTLGRGWVEHVAWSPDGQRVAAALSRVVRVFGSDGTEAWRSEPHPSTVSALAWSGAEQLATACYGRVSFLDAASGTAVQTLEWKGSLVSMVLSPGGEVVACGSQDNSVHFWRRSTEEDSMMHGYAGKPTALAFDASGTLLATGGSEAVTVWSFADGGPEGSHPGVLEVHVRPITTLAFAGRGMRLASGARDGAVVVWSLGRDGQGQPVGAALVDDAVAGVVWRPDDRGLAALDASGGVTVWRVRGS